MRLKMAAFATVLMIPRPSVAAAFAVDSVGDQSDSNPGDGTCATSGGSCTLRAALEEANATAGPHTIDFAIAGAGPHIVKPTTELPAFTEAIALDGYS